MKMTSAIHSREFPDGMSLSVTGGLEIYPNPQRQQNTKETKPKTKMKTTRPLARWLALLALSTFITQPSTVFAQGTAFTYQGRLNNNGSPASGTYNLTFSLFNTNTSGVAVAGPVTDNAVVVTNGLFTVLIDFGPGVFTGATNWLEIAVATNGASPFTTLTPRQQLTPTPYAILAATANGLSGTLPVSQVSGVVPLAQLPVAVMTNNATGVTLSGNLFGNFGGSFYGNGGGLTGLNPANLVGTLADAQLSANIARLNGTNNFTGTNTFAGVTIATNVNNVLNGSFIGNGGGLTNLNTAQFANSVLTNGATGVTLGGTFNGNATTANNFSGSLSGDVTGTQSATVVSSVGGQSAANVASGVSAANAATSAATANTIVKRDASGSFTNTSITLNGNLNLPATTASAGIIYSGGSTLIQSYGIGNFFAGSGAGNTTMATSVAVDNTGVGCQALHSNTNGDFNTAYGEGALYSNTNGSANTANGMGALNGNTSGNGNTANGFQALLFNTSGNYNTANGYLALYSNTNGGDNTANGSLALYSNTSGSGNTANGVNALYSNTNGYDNTANGANALNFNTSGYYNTADGLGALFNNTNGSYNTANGVSALNFNTSGNYNIALGYQAGYNITTGSSNIDIGNQGVATDTNIIRIGSGQTSTYIAGTIYGNGGGLTNLNASQLAGGTIPLAQLPAAVVTNGQAGNITLNGTLTLPATTTADDTIYSGGSILLLADNSQDFFAGVGAGNLTMAGVGGGENTGVGCQALQSNKGGIYNTANGAWALQDNTWGNNNTANGTGALEANTSGSGNTANGTGALFYNTSGSGNTANGASALFYNTSYYNTANGSGALFYNTNGSYNIALGYEAGYNVIGNNNIDIGNEGAASDNGVIRIGTPGTNNTTYLTGTIYGNGGGLTNLNASQLAGGTIPLAQLPATVVTNNEAGVTLNGLSLAGLTQVSSNLFMNNNDIQLRNDLNQGVGWYGAGKLFSGVNVDGPVLYGYSGGGLGYHNNNYGTNLVLYWNNSGYVGIGTSSPDALLSVNGTADKPGGGSWSTFSDGRLKDVGAKFTDGLEALNEIQPVHYHYKSDNPLNLPSQPEYVGVVAQQVQGSVPEAVQRNKDGYLVVNNDPIIWTMLNAIKELNQKRETESKAKDAEIQTLKQQNDSLAERLNELEATVKQLVTQK